MSDRWIYVAFGDGSASAFNPDDVVAWNEMNEPQANRAPTYPTMTPAYTGCPVLIYLRGGHEMHVPLAALEMFFQCRPDARAAKAAAIISR